MSFSVLGRVPADKRQPSGKVVSIESAADAKNVKALDSSPHPRGGTNQYFSIIGMLGTVPD
jgi:hypothetical protein